MAFDRKMYSEELKQRVKESYDTKDQGMFGGSIFKPDLNLPTWKCGEGKHYLDVIPYKAGPNNPKVKEGKPAHNLDIWVHYRIGPNDAPYVCLAKNWNLPCPICEYRKQLMDSEDADEATLKSFLPKHRTIYNVIIRDGGKEEKLGVQVWDVSHFFFEQNVASISERPRQGGFINWPDPDQGKQVMFERKGTGAQNTKFQGHAFIDRDYVIDDQDLEDAFPLDDLIYIPTYEEVRDLLMGGVKKREPVAREEESERKRSTRGRQEEEGPAKEKDEAPPPSRRSRKAPEPEPEEEECPGEFGKNTDNFDECRDCKKYDDCADDFERREEEEKEKKAKAGKGRLRR